MRGRVRLSIAPIRPFNWTRQHRLGTIFLPTASTSRKEAMHKSRIEISDKVRRKVSSLLSASLADAIDLSLQLKQAHWNVKGPNFIALHELFDEVHGVVESKVDELAERLTALGGVAEGTVQAVSKRSSLSPYPLAIRNGREHLEALAGALAAFGGSARKSIGAASAAGDEVTADLFNEITGDIEKQLWFIEAHLQADA
jgi:starvation-inducible DNA-binding protein